MLDRLVTLNDTKFVALGFSRHEGTNVERRFKNDAGDTLNVTVKPTAGVSNDLEAIEPFRIAFHNATIRRAGAVISAEYVDLAQTRGFRTISKRMSSRGGLVFYGVIDAPFVGCRFTWTICCRETPPTGTREAAVLNDLIANGVAFKGGKLAGWARDPYDVTCDAPLLRNASDDEEHDARFPDHPLSRCRVELDRLAESIQFSKDLLATRYLSSVRE